MLIYLYLLPKHYTICYDAIVIYITYDKQKHQFFSFLPVQELLNVNVMLLIYNT